MSTYAQVSDIRRLAPSIAINASTLPSEGAAQQYLDTVEQEINAILGKLGYVVPVVSTAASSRILLNDLVATGALAKVLQARSFGVDTSLIDAATMAEKSYRDRLKALKTANDPFVLPDAPYTDMAALKTPDERSASFADDALDDFDVDCPRVTRTQGF